MSWREQYQKGRFRNAPFVTERHDMSGGRRVVPHQYPQRDKPYPEDMGRSGRTFSLELFVRGPEYMAERDALLEALEAEGPGTLVHPYHGSMQVQVQRYRLRESTRDGGMAQFSVEFLEAGDNQYPQASRDTGAQVRDAADAARSASISNFTDEFSTADQPEWVSARAETLAGRIVDQLQTLSNSAPTSGLKTDFLADMARLGNELDVLVRSPESLGGGLFDGVNGLGGLFGVSLSAFDGLRRLFDFGDDLPSVPTSTRARRRQDRNQDALVTLTRQAGVIEAARVSADIEFDSTDEAIEVRDRIAGELDRQMLTADDLTYPKMQDLRTAVVRDITARGADLASVVDYRPGKTLPALVIAHQLYGDARQEDAIVRRNKRRIRHPGFVPGGRPLEVLTDVG